MNSMLQAAKRQTVPSVDLQRRVRALVARVGLVRAASELGLSRQTVANIAAGFSVHVATITHAEAHAPR